MRLNEPVRYRLSVTLRAIAAIGGGYVLSAAVIALLAALLPMARAEAVVTVTLLSFLIYASVVLWVFSVRSVVRVWVWMLIVMTLLAVALWLQRGMQ